MTIEYLRRHKLVYLASPYTKFKPDIDAAHAAVCVVAAKLMQADVYVLCPIAHGHSIARLGGIDPVDEPFWSDMNRPLQEACDALAICKLPGWHESAGITAEFADSQIHRQPVYYIDPQTMQVTRGSSEAR